VYMCQKLRKLDDSRQSYCKNYLAYFFGPRCILRFVVYFWLERAFLRTLVQITKYNVTVPAESTLWWRNKKVCLLRVFLTGRIIRFVCTAFYRASSVCLSVCLSRWLDQHHIGWISWKLIARFSPTPSLFVAQRPSTYSQGNMGKFGGD